MKTSTWTRDSHMLYDYENNGVTKKALKVLSTCVVVRSENDVSLSNDLSHEPLVMIRNDSSEFSIQSIQIYPLWLVIRNSRSSQIPNSYTLLEGTIIKLGRLQFRVKSIKTKEETFEETIAEVSTEKDATCRICLSESLHENNPLISVCKCAGTMGFIHIECLQQWISSRITTNVTENSVMKYVKSIHCELCKMKLPFIIRANNQCYDLFKGEKPQFPYLILEGLQTELREPGVYFINFINKCSVMLGRGHDSDVRIPDISVSRCHAKIRFADDVFTIQDNNSKFGTLVMMQDTVLLKQNMAIQCGRTVMQFSHNPVVVNPDNMKFDWEQD